ncbi:MAG: hypothetical protein HY646_11620 [Acidobacteria bacterium]|nr:hypothetical protein [Acidobacteriota bacterium]
MSQTTGIRVVCPCCGARLTVDAELRKVIAHETPPRQSQTPDLDNAAALLEQNAARREALFKQSTEEEKVRSKVLERKFEEALKKSKDQPVSRPTRDIDLD